MSRVEIVSFGTRQWSARLRGMAEGAQHPRMFFETEIIPDMERIEQAVFNSQGRRGGGSWKALSPETIRQKAAAGLDPRINIATGRLLASVTESRSEDAVRVITGNRLRFGTTAPGAAQSQRNRPFVRFTKFDRRRWAKWWAQYIVRFGSHV